ncbi:hypothetical protein MRX96_031803 [Rhipicephalus microplus]
MRRLVVYPLPKNMGPGESEGRRAARARALLLQHQNDEGAVYVDVAKVKNKDAYVAAAVAATTGKIVTSCSVRTRSASQAEEMAIALAARSPGVRTILSDSKTAIRSFSRGAVCGAAARALASDESKFLPGLSSVLHPLNELLGDKVSWEWREDHELYAQPVERPVEVFMLVAAYSRVLRSTVVMEATSKDPTFAELRDALWSGAELRDPELRFCAGQKLQMSVQED